jgi:hypothetical protein
LRKLVCRSLSYKGDCTKCVLFSRGRLISSTTNSISWVEVILSRQCGFSHLLHVRYLWNCWNSIARRNTARARKEDKYILVREEKEAAMIGRRKEFEETEDKASNRIAPHPRRTLRDDHLVDDEDFREMAAELFRPLPQP